MSTISTIATAQKSISSRTVIADQDRAVQTARQELVTGIKADVYADKSFRSAQTLDLRNRMAQAEAYATSNKLLVGKLDITAEVMSNVRTSAQEFQALALSLSMGSQRRDVLQGQAEAVLSTLTSQLNTVFGGEYLFSGMDTSSQPLRLPEDGPDPAYLPGDATMALVERKLTNLDVYFGLQPAPANRTTWNNSVYGGSDALATARLDQTTSFDYGMTGNDEAIRQLAKGLLMYARTDIDTIENPEAYKAWINEANAALNLGIEGIASQEIVLGNQRDLLAQTVERQESLIGIYNNRVLDIEGVDEYEVATRLESLSAQLEASYAVTVRLKNLTLLNFL